MFKFEIAMKRGRSYSLVPLAFYHQYSSTFYICAFIVSIIHYFKYLTFLSFLNILWIIISSFIVYSFYNFFLLLSSVCTYWFSTDTSFLYIQESKSTFIRYLNDLTRWLLVSLSINKKVLQIKGTLLFRRLSKLLCRLKKNGFYFKSSF